MSKRTNNKSKSTKRYEAQRAERTTAQDAKWAAEDRSCAERELALAGMAPAQIRRALRAYDRKGRRVPHSQRSWQERFGY